MLLLLHHHQSMLIGKYYPALLLNRLRFLHLNHVESSFPLSLSLSLSANKRLPSVSSSSEIVGITSRNQCQQYRLLQHHPNNPVATRMAASAQQESKVVGASDYDQVLHQQKQKDSVPMEKKDADDGDDDLMSESYGEGYATRSSEEGFGGVYSHPVGGSREGSKTLEGHDKEREWKQRSHHDVATGVFLVFYPY